MSATLNLGTDGNWATKKDTILAYNDENSNFKPLPFSFDRASSATRVNKDGLIETVGSGEPRIDYKDDSKGALKLEPSRTNYVTYSEDFSDASWVKSAGTTLTSNYGIAPNGLNQSTLIEWSATQQFIYTIISSQGQETSSIYIKGISGQEIKFGRTGTVATGNLFTFDGTWQRLEISTDNAETVLFLSTFNDGNATDFEIWGAQLEQGSYATSYIPTQGSIGTRVAESCNQTPPSGIIGQTEGTLFADIYLNLAGSNIGFYALQVYDNSFSPSYGKAVYLELYQGKVYGYVRNSTVQCEILSGIYADGQRLKMALAYKSNDFALYVNGVQIGIDTNGSLPSVLNDVSLHYSAGTQQASPLSQAQIYNTRLSNAELQALTTI